jgi:hypothetical protein
VRAHAAESALLGRSFSDAAIVAAAEAAGEVDTNPSWESGPGEISAVTQSRRQAFTVLARRALSQARESV